MGNKDDVVNYYSLVALLVLVIWSTFVLAWIAHGQVRREDWRLQFRGSFLLNLVLAPFLFCALTMAGGFALAYPLANAEFKQKYTFRPYLLAGLVEETSADDHLTSMTVGIVNNTDKSLQFDGRQAEVRYGGTYHGEIIDMKPPAGPVLTLLPHEHGWLVLSLTPEKFVRSLSQIEASEKLILRLKRVPTSDGPNVISVIVRREKKQADQEN